MQHLIRGHDFLASHPGFRLIGREDYRNRLASILMRKKANSVLLVGPSGAGATALCLGLQTLKEEPDAPFDIVSKRLFWLDTDSLFSCGDGSKINGYFQKVIDTMNRTPDSVLIIEDTRDFMEAARNTGNSHFINRLTACVKSNKTQVILEVRDDDLSAVLKWHSDIRESYTLLDLNEPLEADLIEIVREAGTGLFKHHGVRISDAAYTAAVEVTNKYRTEEGGLSCAQPERAITLLDRSLSAYRMLAHKKPPYIAKLEAALASASEGDRASLQDALRKTTAAWMADQEEIKKLYNLQRDGETAVMELEDELDEAIRAENEKKERNEAVQETAPVKRTSFSAMVGNAGFDSDKVSGIKERIQFFRKGIAENRAKFNEVTERINADLELDRDFVLAEFSKISGIDVSKLNENDLDVLQRLDETFHSQVFGQQDAVEKVSNGIKVAKLTKRPDDKPVGAFMFLGPSGVGKTKIAQILAETLGIPLLRFDMSEYMEKHSVARMIGAPPGYEGFEAGGILTNAIRRTPSCVLLLDEIEKAHPDVFNVLLQVLDAARLTDNVGRVIDFRNVILVATTNLGQQAFLDQSLTFDEASAQAMAEVDATYKNEFLNRFEGRQNIVPFRRLELDSVERIAKRELGFLAASYADSKIDIFFDEGIIKPFCADQYEPKQGARGLPGFIRTKLSPYFANWILNNRGVGGSFQVGYDTATKNFQVSPKETAYVG